MENTLIHGNLGNRLHYSFLLDDENHLIPCDTGAQKFLEKTDTDILGGHIINMKFHSAMINSTILLDRISYSLKVVPVSAPKLRQNPSHGRWPSNITHIVILQNQFLFSELLHKIGKYTLLSKEFENLIKDYDDAIYINKANGDPLYFNNRYLEVTRFTEADFFGESADNSDPNFFMPVVTPTVMKNNLDVTTFQHLKSGVDIITTGIPVYLNTGEFKFVLFLVSPLSNNLIHASHILSMKEAVSSQIQKGTFHSPTYIDIIAESPMMKKCVQDAIKLSAYNVPCLLLGASGCGKEIFASLIHATSRRNTNPFVKINCSALSPTLLESELFGYEAGAFTGALAKGKKGFFETATNGTLLLDEIADMPLDSQAKLLRVLETGEIYKVGGNVPIKVDVRIIAATNKDLKDMIKKGTFRSDLYYRLNVASIHLPDLKDRKEDIPLFIKHFSYYYNKKYQTSKVFSDELIDALEKYNWPGNVRELKNVIERLTLLSSSTELTLDDIADTDMLFSPKEDLDIMINGIPYLDDAVDAVEKTLVTRALSISGNTRRAAEMLNVSQSTIMRKIRKFNL